jgi:hypothetical protein
MAKIQVKVTMANGSGMGLFIRVEENNLFFDRSGVQTLELAPQTYVATVGGHEPSSANVLIEFIEEENIIGGQAFNTPTFFGFIPFDVI